MTKYTEISRPVSAVNHAAALASLFSALASLILFKWFGSRNAEYCLVAVVIFIAMPHIGDGMKFWDNPFYSATNWRRFGIKLFGQLGLFAGLAFTYFIFHGFFENFILPLSALGGNLVLLAIIATPFYIWLTDKSMTQPEDGLYQFGLCLLGGFRVANMEVLQQYLLGWVVKGFFGPLMAGYALKDMRWFLEIPISGELYQPSDVYEVSYRMFYFIDVIFAVTGYLCTFRLLNTQIRSTDPTMFGWVVCLLCYQPFWNLFSSNFFPYEDGYYWQDWLVNSPSLWLAWASLIVISTIIYLWAAVSFGIRFSNLTNRGILTNGPYRWMKHPAYVAKNLSWWLIAVPFVSNSGISTIIRDCTALALVNGVYFLRAKTEERHLGRDPDYVAYCKWMETNSLYAKLKALVVR
jgi:protein-S-isoprenylcysteine O-methyltransferase Ste14